MAGLCFVAGSGARIFDDELSDYGEIMLKWVIIALVKKRGGAAGGRESMSLRGLKVCCLNGVLNSSPLSPVA